MTYPPQGPPPLGPQWGPLPPQEPQQGPKKKHKKWPWITGGGLVLLIIVVVGASGGASKTTAAVATSTTAATTTTAAPAVTTTQQATPAPITTQTTVPTTTTQTTVPTTTTQTTVPTTTIAPAPTTRAPTPAGLSSDNGWTLNSIQTKDDGLGDFGATARITNNSGSDVQGGLLKVTLLQGNDVVATLMGSVDKVANGKTVTVQMFSQDKYVQGQFTPQLQMDGTF